MRYMKDKSFNRRMKKSLPGSHHITLHRIRMDSKNDTGFQAALIYMDDLPDTAPTAPATAMWIKELLLVLRKPRRKPIARWKDCQYRDIIVRIVCVREWCIVALVW